MIRDKVIPLPTIKGKVIDLGTRLRYLAEKRHQTENPKPTPEEVVLDVYNAVRREDIGMDVIKRFVKRDVRLHPKNYSE